MSSPHNRRTGVGLYSLNSTFPPLPTTNLFGWWRSDRAFTDAGKTTLCSSSGSDTCYTLEDQSGNSRDLIQATGANRPVWYSNQVNSYPALRFDGTNDELGRSQSQTLPFTAYLIVKQITWTNNDDLIEFDLDASGIRIQQITSTPLVQVCCNSTTKVSTTGTPSLNVWHMIAGVFNGSGTIINIDNLYSNSGTGAILPVASMTEIYLGSSHGQNWSNIDFAEAIIFTGAHSIYTGDGLATRKYLRKKYNLF